MIQAIFWQPPIRRNYLESLGFRADENLVAFIDRVEHTLDETPA
jgi:hypothetical protein